MTMTFSDVITRADSAPLSTEEVAQLQTELVDTSWLFRLATRLPDMTKAQRRIPVWQSLPKAYFVEATTNSSPPPPSTDKDYGYIQTSDVDWTNRYVDAEEIAVIVPIPKAVLADSDYDIWEEIRPKIVEAFDRAITGAVLLGTTPYGQTIPTTWSTNMGGAGILAGATAAGHVVSAASYTDLYEAILGESDTAKGVCMLVEEDGFMATGHVGATTMRGKLRNVRAVGGEPIFVPSMQGPAQYQLDGAPIFFPRDGIVNAASALLISGQWDKLVYAFRQDIEWELSTQGTISNDAGKIVFNLFQQNMVGLKVTMRLGFALPNPKNYANPTDATRYPFAVLTA